MTNSITRSAEQDPKPRREVERKFLPLMPDALSDMRERARPIEQFYLSHPSEPFSLRLREELNLSGKLEYSATLKDRGQLTVGGIDRLEIEVPVSSELYHYYKPDMPLLRKLRAKPSEAVAVDFYEDGHIQVESEDPLAWNDFCRQYGSGFIDMTGQHNFDNEWRAHLGHARQNDSREALEPLADLDPDIIVNDVIELYDSSLPIFVKVSGRSGSGKSTLVRQLQQSLSEFNIKSEVISTDDYHRGASWLQAYNNGSDWVEWDHPIVYDTAAMARDLKSLSAGEAVDRRRIDFSVVEPVYEGSITPVPVLIIEGIYAGHSDFDSLESLNYAMPTPLATCIGRRLLRDISQRPEFANPEKSLHYMLTQAEPTYRKQLLS